MHPWNKLNNTERYINQTSNSSHLETTPWYFTCNMQWALNAATYVYYMRDKPKLCNSVNEILFAIKEYL
jgi:hypothetical protein